jgi:hypothetical protein
MLHHNSYYAHCTARRWWRLGSLAVLMCLFFSTTVSASAQDPAQEGPNKCAQCHQAEADTWGASPHAQIMTCEECHGEYVQGHPQEGVMELKVDSSMCWECHTTTTQEWQTTAHAEAGVQCISCHRAHTQETRLADMALCGSCHGERVDTFEHTAHSAADLACTACHLSSPSGAPSGATIESAVSAAPSHTFRTEGTACASCHGDEIHQQVMNAEVARIDAAELTTMSERAQDLARELDDAKRANRSLRALSVVSLGAGLGIGGVLGIIIVSAICYFSKEGLLK